MPLLCLSCLDGWQVSVDLLTQISKQESVGVPSPSVPWNLWMNPPSNM